MHQRPLLIPLVSLIAGLCAAHLAGFTAPWWALALLLGLALTSCFTAGSIPFSLSSATLFFVWGALSLEPFLSPPEIFTVSGRDLPVTIQGVVDERPRNRPDGFSLVVAVKKVTGGALSSLPKRLLVQAGSGRGDFATGDEVLFSARIRKPRPYGLPGERNYVRALAYRGIFATAWVKEPGDIVLVRGGEGWRHAVDRIAASLSGFVSRNCPGTEGTVLKALLLGDQGEVPPELNEAYARSGINHILSISGFHIGIIFLCVFQALFWLARRSEWLALRVNLRRMLMLAALPVVVFYLFLSGAAPATVRSVLMIAAFACALQVRREADPVNSLMLAAAAMLFAAPETLFDLSFQLSFLAIWGLVVLSPFAPAFDGIPRPLRWLLLLMTASAAAILATLVPVAYYFHRVSATGLLANLVVVPLMGYGAVVVGFLSLPLSWFAETPASWLLDAAAWLVGICNRAILPLSRLPVATGYAPTGLDFLLSVLILAALTWLRSRAVKGIAVAVLAAFLVLRPVAAIEPPDGRFTLYFLSVGQGDSTLIRLPDGKWMLIDGGGRADGGDWAGERLLLPALWRLGVGRIDYLVLSHPHPDHLQGVLYLAKQYEVGELWESSASYLSPECRELNWVASAKGIPVRLLSAEVAPFPAGGARVEPLWPPLGWQPPSGDANEESLVLRLVLGKGAALFPGDLGAEGEGGVLERGDLTPSSILKVGHHGSRYSSSDPFLHLVSPKLAVISAGFGNPFRLPAPSTLQRLRDRHIPIHRTDLDGTVKVICDSEGVVSVSLPWRPF
ncbi:DNA internalization-related competence protein ComEC/Rec2 [Geomonas sp. Red32]|uniref:DNA internalization-related competence protein ComEC/Rec2 n=1 Tax=Geomonas sp. Red32 TaxID=2912856 RepID=UPI00202CC45C|nr:DNA internalization-related competence protein ComEC/Rec2 [Geomonas sp. Red32]MCM0082330.1 DNA internalization-related competence protein ComEC/Rec2 [Geomonas sp. Red32]